MNRQHEGVTFEVAPESDSLVRGSGGAPSQLYLGYGSMNKDDIYRSALLTHVAELLTGLSRQKLTALGGFEFVDMRTNRVVQMID